MRMTTAAEAAEYIQGLQELIEFLKSHPECTPLSSFTVNLFPDDIRAVRGYGKLEKKIKGDWFTLVKTFRNAVTIEWNAPREEVCKRVKVGTKFVPARPEEEVPVYAWECPDSILGGNNLQPATDVVE